MKAKLSASMTPAQFDNGYWYAVELRKFARSIGVPSASKLRKDELETALKGFLETGEVPIRAGKTRPRPGARDVDRGLRLGLPVTAYINDAETKNFLEREARKLAPGFKRRSGARYRLNRWREEKTLQGVRLTYRDLVGEYVRLNRTGKPFARIPHGRYINFMSDFLAGEKGSTRAQAIRAWKKLKTLDAPKNYASWLSWRRSGGRSR